MNDIAGDISRLLAEPDAQVSREWMEELLLRRKYDNVYAIEPE